MPALQELFTIKVSTGNMLGDGVIRNSVKLGKDMSWLDGNRGGALVKPAARRIPVSRFSTARNKGLFDSAARLLADKWNALEARYGRAQAIGMLGAMLATIPIPGNIAAVIAAAEALRYFRGTAPTVGELGKALAGYHTKEWITIGGHDCEDGKGKHCDGTPVEISKDGKIRKGPAGLIGLKPSQLSRRNRNKPKTAAKPSEQPARKPETTQQEKPKPKQETKPAPKLVAEKPSKPEPTKTPERQKTPLEKFAKKPNAKVERGNPLYQQRVKSAMQSLFGKEIDDSTIAAIGNGVDGAKIEISAPAPGAAHITIGLSYNHEGVQANRSISTDDNGETYIHNDLFKIEETSKHRGKGVEFFASQVAALKEAGVSYIETHAAGSATSRWFNGYYSWPRMGYDSPLLKGQVMRLPKKLQDQLGGNPTVQQLFALPGGKEAWEIWGSGLGEAKFDLKEGSESLKVLNNYLQEREKASAKPKEEREASKARVKEARKNMKNALEGYERWVSNNLPPPDQREEKKVQIWEKYIQERGNED